MTTTDILVLVLLGVIAGQIVLTLRAGFERRRVLHATRVERTRAHFAETRNELFELARRSKVDMQSWTFVFFNAMLTTAMRRTDEYRKMADYVGLSMVAARTGGVPRNEALQQEFATWGPELRTVAARSAEGFLMLIRDYSRAVRITERVVHVTPKPFRSVAHRVQAWVERVEEARPIMREFYSGQRHLAALSAGVLIAAATVGGSSGKPAGCDTGPGGGRDHNRAHDRAS